jgi:lipoprotein-releasing system permease protein
MDMVKKTKTNFRWVIYVALRYMSTKARSSSTSSILSVLEIAIGVMALTIILAVMNGFQLGYIENILEVSSYYVRVDNFPIERLNESNILEDINKIDGITSAVPFKETQGIIKGNSGTSQSPIVLRGLGEDAFKLDNGLKHHIEIIKSKSLHGNEGGWYSDINADDLLREKNSIMLGSEFAYNLGLDVGDKIEFASISGLFSSDEVDEDSIFEITGIFKTGYYEYDLGWGFINIERALALENNADSATIGIKINNRYNDLKTKRDVTNLINSNLGEEQVNAGKITVSSWRDYNKAFFGALRTEKLMMFVLVGLIFVVVALNIFQAQRRSILERNEELGLLRAIGANNFLVRCVVAFKGLAIGFIGASTGMTLAILIATHIQSFFSALEKIITTIMHIFYYIIYGSFFVNNNFEIFNKQIFYLNGITARLMVPDVILIYLFGLLSAVSAAWIASRRVLKINPAEILRNE